MNSLLESITSRYADFCDARGFWNDWQQVKNQLDFARKDMITACFIHYFCNTPTVSMWYLGSPFVSAHCDTETILATLHPMIDPAIFTKLARACQHGCPQLINATPTDAHFWQAVAYGNHKSVSQEPLKIGKSIMLNPGRSPGSWQRTDRHVEVTLATRIANTLVSRRSRTFTFSAS
jgi:hypothetical protein